MIENLEYQEEMNELLRMKKQLTGAQGCSCQSQQRNEWKAHCLSAGIYALSKRIKHGEWIIDEFGHKCSVCREYVESPPDGESIHMKYCPNCGAEMDVI